MFSWKNSEKIKFEILYFITLVISIYLICHIISITNYLTGNFVAKNLPAGKIVASNFGNSSAYNFSRAQISPPHGIFTAQHCTAHNFCHDDILPTCLLLSITNAKLANNLTKNATVKRPLKMLTYDYHK